MKEIAASTASLVTVQERTFWFNRRRVVRLALADDREMWFESSAANPTLRQLARQFDAAKPPP